MTSPLIVPIAEALEADWNTHTVQYTRSFLDDGATATDACIAVVAALPADYTAVDVLAFLRGEDVPSEPLPVKAAPYADEHRRLGLEFEALANSDFKGQQEESGLRFAAAILRLGATIGVAL